MLQEVHFGYIMSRSGPQVSTNVSNDSIQVGDILKTQNLENALRKEFGNAFCVFEEIDSTNSYIKREANHLPDGYLVCSLGQTAGRGRFGKSFASPPGGIYLSMLFRPVFSAEQCFELTPLTAVAVCSAIERVCNVMPGIKWVNDIVLGERKICGILSEIVFDDSGGVNYVIIGIGLNVNTERKSFLPELAEIATSIYEETGQRNDVATLSAEIAKEIRDAVSAFPGNRDDILYNYRQRCSTLGRQVRVFTGEGYYEAYADRIDDNFHLFVRCEGGECRKLLGGDVSVRGLCGYI